MNIEKSGFYYTNQMARPFLLSAEKVIGAETMAEIYAKSGVPAKYCPPPDNSLKEFDFAYFSAIVAVMQEVYGLQHEIFLQIGEETQSKTVPYYEGLFSLSQYALSVFSVETRLFQGLKIMADVFRRFTDQYTTVEDGGAYFIYTIHHCPVCWGRQADKPICYIAAALIQAGFQRMFKHQTLRIEEVACHAKGDKACVFHIWKELLPSTAQPQPTEHPLKKLYHRLLNWIAPQPENVDLVKDFEAEEIAFLWEWIIPLNLLSAFTLLLFVPLVPLVYQPQYYFFAMILSSLLVLNNLTIAATAYRWWKRIDVCKLIFMQCLFSYLITAVGMVVNQRLSFAYSLYILTTTAVIALMPYPGRWLVSLYLTIDLLYTATIPLFQDNAVKWQMFTFSLGLLVNIMFMTLGHTFLARARLQTFTNLWQTKRLKQLAETYTSANDQLLTTNRFLQEELALARDMQQSLLQKSRPDLSGLAIICDSSPARQVGGDFYAYKIFQNWSKYTFAVGDVSGKGVSAALLMATSLSLFNTHLTPDLPPHELLKKLDQFLLPYTKPRRQNCALCVVELNLQAAPRLIIANAGGIPPYIKRASGAVVWPEIGGFALGQGLSELLGYQQIDVSLAKGDLVILVSVVEAMNERRELFGFDRLQALIERAPSTDPTAMLNFLKQEITLFVGETEPHDDMTIVVVQV